MRPPFLLARVWAEIINTDAIWRFEDYARLFDGARDERAVGEVCPRYLFQLGTAAKIARRLPDVRIVAVLRHPAERAFSGFAMYRRDGFEPCATLDAAIDDEPRRIRENWAYAIHVDYGFYHRQLQEYVEVLPRQNIKCFLYEDLVEQPAWFFTELFEFIGVDPGFTPDSSRRHNASGMIRNPVLRAKFPFGNPTFLAGALIPGLTLAIWMIYHQLRRAGQGNPAAALAKAAGCLLATALILWTLKLSGSRGPMVGAGVAKA